MYLILRRCHQFEMTCAFLCTQVLRLGTGQPYQIYTAIRIALLMYTMIYLICEVVFPSTAAHQRAGRNREGIFLAMELAQWLSRPQIPTSLWKPTLLSIMGVKIGVNCHPSMINGSFFTPLILSIPLGGSFEHSLKHFGSFLTAPLATLRINNHHKMPCLRPSMASFLCQLGHAHLQSVSAVASVVFYNSS